MSEGERKAAAPKANKEAPGRKDIAGVNGGGPKTSGREGQEKPKRSPGAIARENFSKDKADVYRPLVRHLRGIYKGAGARERDIPMGRIARMQLVGLFLPGRHEKLYDDVREVLTASKDYVEFYWKLQNKMAREFDSQMRRDGIHATNTKEYISLRNSIAEGIIMESGKYWSLSYDGYIERLRETARKTDRKPRGGNEMYGDLAELFGPEMKKLKELQAKVGTMARKLEKKVKAIRGNSPEYKPGL